MATQLQWLLQILCSRKTKWNYAVFWKLRHHVPMILTCEDACYYNHFEHDASETKSLETLHDGHFTHDPLGLAVEKMSYQVYSHGEGIVGQVAATGSHRWISAVDHPGYPFPSPELDGWQTQFSVGIKTIVFVAVPHGVVQLGSLSEVNEDQKLLSYTRNLFSSLQDSSTCYVQNPFNLCTEIAMQQMSNTSSTTLHPNALENQTTVMDLEDHFSEERLTKPVTSVPLEKLKVENNAEIQSQCELYGAIGPTFLRQCCPISCEVDTEDRPAHNIPEMIESSLLTSDYAEDNLLETMVVKACLEDGSVENVGSLSTSESTLTTEANPRLYFNQNHTVGSPFTDCSSVLEESAHDCLRSSNSCSVGSSTHVCKEPTVNSFKLGRFNKKRARPGKSSCSRPRDRELVEDRIKQLRRLVPNGSKCSIDSLLERTIKHLVFLQDAAMKADKFSNSSKSKNCSNDTRMLGSGYDRGSCWAVEVGKDICPIVVENLSVDGQMLIEMLFEDWHNFLGIAESIRSLGLTILKALMETRGDKVWMRFVVEGRGNKVPHRTQVLWSLLQLLQVEPTVT